MKKLTIRMEDEGYERLKKYAKEHGESINDVVTAAVERLLAGGEPAPSPGLPPGPGPELSKEIRELRERVKKLEEGGAEVQGYLQGVHERLNSLGTRVSITEAHLGIPPEMPGWPKGYKAGARGKGRTAPVKAAGKKAKK